MKYHTPKHQMTKKEAQTEFYYKDGQLYRNKSVPGHLKGTSAGHIISTTGYFTVTVRYKRMQLHNVIWNYHNGIIPDGYCIDHIDKNRGNNHIRNLRLVTHSQNKLHNNTKNTTGCPGVSKQGDGFTSRLMKDGKYILCKYFHNFLDACAARKSAEASLI